MPMFFRRSTGMFSMPWLLAVLALVGLISACSPNIASEATAIEANADACAKTINAYAHARDAGDADAFAALFTEDAVMTIGDMTLSGRDAIVAAMKTRAAQSATMHMVGSVVVDVVDRDTATARSYTAVFAPSRADLDEVARLLALATYQDDMILDGGACVFTKRTVTIGLTSPA